MDEIKERLKLTFLAIQNGKEKEQNIVVSNTLSHSLFLSVSHISLSLSSFLDTLPALELLILYVAKRTRSTLDGALHLYHTCKSTSW